MLKTGKELEAVSRKSGVRFALENVLPGPATELVETALKYLDPTCFGFCYDSSHDQIGGPKPFDLLLRQKNRVFAVHLSDRTADFVDHMPPGEGWINWETLIAALKTGVFSGPLLFEVMVTNASQKDTDAFLELVYRQANWINVLFQQSF